jgi:hypothetical protein
MSTAEKKQTSLSLDVLADLAEVLRQAEQGIVRDPVLIRRVTERSERVQEDLRQKHAELNVAVDLIREIRDEE